MMHAMASPCVPTNISKSMIIENKIRDRIRDPEMFDEGEPRPSEEVIERALNLIRAVEEEEPLPECSVEFFHGELDLTWKHQDRLLMLIVHSDPDRSAELYWRRESPGAFVRGEHIEVRSADDLIEKLRWIKE